VRQIAARSFGIALGAPRVATCEAAALNRHAGPCIIEIKNCREVSDSLDQLSQFLQRPARVALTPTDEQILALP
jgi:hypothetical protein